MLVCQNVFGTDWLWEGGDSNTELVLGKGFK